jgi:hypothetical protein
MQRSWRTRTRLLAPRGLGSSCYEIVVRAPPAQFLENAHTLAGAAGLGRRCNENPLCGRRSDRSGDREHARLRTRVWARRSSVDHRIVMTGSAIPTTGRRPIHPAWESISRRSPARAAAPRVDVARRDRFKVESPRPRIFALSISEVPNRRSRLVISFFPADGHVPMATR